MEQQPDGNEHLDDSPAAEVPEPERLTQAARRERLDSVQAMIGERAQRDGDVIVIEAGEPVVLHIEIDREGVFSTTWWATALTDNAHHRWRDAAAEILRDGEEIHTSALGGGFLVEISTSTRDEDVVVVRAEDVAPVDRVRELIQSFPEAVAALPDEPVPDYLVPPEPELPALGEADVTDVADDENLDSEDLTS